MDEKEIENEIGQLQEQIQRLKEKKSLRQRKDYDRKNSKTEETSDLISNKKENSNKEESKERSYTYEYTYTAIIIKNILILVIFFALHYCYEQYFFNPIFRKQSEINFDEITSKICPQGATDCSVQLKSNWKQLIKDSL